MNFPAVAVLFRSDLKAIRYWFQTNTYSKILVLAAFTLVFVCVSFAIYLISSFFFRYLDESEVYGQLTSLYIVHSGLVLVIFFGIMSTFLSVYTTISSRNASLEYLTTLPLSQGLLARWILLRTMVINAVLFTFFIAPMIVAFAQWFLENPLNAVPITVLLIVAISVITASLGSIFSYIALLWLRQNRFFYPIIAIGTVFGLIALVRIIFPRSIIALYTATPEQFLTIYNSLPLSNGLLPSYWLASMTVFGGLENYLRVGLAVIVLWAIVDRIIAALFTYVYQRISEQSYSRSFGPLSTRSATPMLESRHPFLLKELMSIVRTPSELLYGLYLAGIGIIFFMLYVQAINRNTELDWNTQMTLIALSWILFITTAFFLRIVFPLMAREGHTRWYLFSLPFRLETILNTKVLIAVVLAIILTIPISILWMFMPSHVVGLNRIPMLGLCILGILTLSIIHGTLGAFHPNFSEGDNPEQVSTSTMGLLALAMSVVEIFLLNWVGYRILENTMSVPVGFSLAGSISLLIASWLYIGTRQHFLHHETNHN